MKKLFTYLIAFCFFIIPIYAEGSDEDTSTYGIGCNASTAYIQSSKSLPVSIDTTVTAINSTGTAQTMSYSKSRTVSFTGNVSAKTDRDLIIGKVGINAEVGFGVTTTRSITVSTNVPAYTTYYCDIGSSLVKTEGTLKYTYDDCTIAQKAAYLNYSSGPYVHWYQ